MVHFAFQVEPAGIGVSEWGLLTLFPYASISRIRRWRFLSLIL